MSKEPAGKARGRAAIDSTEVAESPAQKSDTAPPSDELAQTEDFTMPSDDAAADFLLGDDDDGGGKTEMLGAPAKKAEKKSQAHKPAGSPKPAPKPEPEPESNPNLAETETMEAPAEEAKPAAETAAKPAAAAASESSATGQRAVLLGDYRLIKKLGQGGMGAVYKALNIKLEKEVALKVLSKDLASKPAFVQRFQREAKVMAKLDHPHILRCYDVGAAGGHHYLVMEYVDGGSVETWLKKLGRLAIGDALHIVLKTAEALLHAHELKLIHRDIKADNILLTAKGTVKVADLGLAKATDEDMGLTKTGTGAGTPLYMAPEQARDVKHVDGRVDIYALGVLLYILLTGEMPFKGETLVEVIEAKEKGKFAPIRKHNDEVPERLDLIVGKMVAVKPEHRYASCAEIIADLEALGLAHDRLSFVAGAAKPTAKVSPAAIAKTAAPTLSATAMAEAAKEEAKTGDVWYWRFENEQGDWVTKNLSKEKMITLIKSGAIDTDAEVSRNAKAGFRAVATYGEFLPHLQKNIITEKVEKKGERFRDMYEKILEEEKTQKRWRWFRNLTQRVGGGVGLILWLCIIAAVIVGAFFGVKWLIEYFGATVADKAGVK